MRAFEYVSPTTLEQAVDLLSNKRDATAVLAGGTDLLALMKDEVISPKRIVNLKGIDRLGYISYRKGTELRLGALVTFQQILEHAEVRER